MKLDQLVKIFFCDPAGGKTTRTQQLKRTSARSAIIGIGCDDLARIFVLHAWAKRCSTDELVDHIFKTCDEHKPKIFGVEANAMQSLFGDMILREAKQKQVRLPIVEVPQNTHVEKKWRIRTTLQPVMAEGRLFVMSGHHELRAELASFPMSPVVDMVDALASAIALAPRRAMSVQRREEVDAYADYLRRSGMPSRQIQEQVEAYRLQSS